MGYIYKITNLVNNKIYVGKTASSISKRFSQHAYDAKNKTSKGYNFLIHKAFRKYGVKNFKIEEVERVENNNSVLNNREIYWISHFQSMMPNGYNMTFGGEGNVKINYDKVYKLWDDGKCITQIYKELNCSTTQLKTILSEYSNFSSEENYQRTIALNKKQVEQYNKSTGELIHTFPSIKDAAEAVGVNRSCISRCCSGQKKSSKGYVWKFKEE